MNITKFKASLRRFSAHTLVILIAFAFTLGIVELVGRFVLKYSGESTNSETRPFEPYFVSGDFYGLVTTSTLLKSPEGPAGYGYQRQYGLYLIMHGMAHGMRIGARTSFSITTFRDIPPRM